MKALIVVLAFLLSVLGVQLNVAAVYNLNPAELHNQSINVKPIHKLIHKKVSTLPSDDDIADFLATNYPQILTPIDEKEELYEKHPEKIYAKHPESVSGFAPGHFELYDLLGDGNILLVIDFGVPGTDFVKSVPFKFIDNEFKDVDLFDSYELYTDVNGNIILHEYHFDNYHKYYYLDTTKDKFEKELFLHLEGPDERVSGKRYDYPELLAFYEQLDAGLEEIKPLPKENIEEMILSRIEGMPE